MAVTLTHVGRITTGTSGSFTVPSGADLLLMIAGAESSNLSGSFSPTHSGSDTWTVQAERKSLLTGTNNGIGIATITNPTAGTFTLGVVNSGGWGGSNGFVQIYALTGVDTSDPIGAIGFGSRSGSSTTSLLFNDSDASTPAGQTLITEAAGSLVIAVLTNGGSAETQDPPTGWVEDFDVSGTGLQMLVATREIGSAATDLGSETWSIPTGANRATTLQIEIKAAATGPVTVTGNGTAAGSSSAVAAGSNATPPIVDISFQFAETGLGNSVHSATASADGLLLAWFWTDEAGASIVLGASWTQEASGTHQNQQWVMASRRIAAGASTFTGGGSGAERNISAFYPGAYSIGAISSVATGTSASPSIPALTCQRQTGKSWIGLFIGTDGLGDPTLYNGTNCPAPFTFRRNQNGFNGTGNLSDTNAGTNSYAGGTWPADATPTSIPWYSFTFELQQAINRKSGDGSAAGSSAATAQGRTVKRSNGSAAGTSSATGETKASSTGTAAGSSSATAQGGTFKRSDGNAPGSSAATAEGRTVKSASGTAGGSSGATGEGVTLKRSDGSAAGSSAATGQGVTIIAGTSSGTAAGSSTATAQGITKRTASGTAAGSSTASAEGKASTPEPPTTARGGGGGGPASDAAYNARQEYLRQKAERERQLWEGKPQEPAPAEQKTQTKPATATAPDGETFEVLYREIMQAPFIPAMPFELPMDDDEAEVLLLLL